MWQRLRHDERGMAATIVLFPLFAVVTFMFVQAISWQHDRQLANWAADQASSAVALYGTAPSSAEADATATASPGRDGQHHGVDQPWRRRHGGRGQR